MGICFCKENQEKNISVNMNALYYIPPVAKGKVIKVYDGDTITILAYCENDPEKQLFKFRVRLANIDCPELRTADVEEKQMAIIARDRLKERIMDKMIYLQDVKLDKYGRLLAKIVYNNVCLNDWLLQERLAIKYDGKTKKIPKSWKKYYLNGEM